MPGLESLANDFLGFTTGFYSWVEKSFGSAEILATFQRLILGMES